MSDHMLKIATYAVLITRGVILTTSRHFYLKTNDTVLVNLDRKIYTRHEISTVVLLPSLLFQWSLRDMCMF